MNDRTMRDLPDMPTSMAARERDHRGLPIPWFVRRPAAGPIDFRVMDINRHRQALQERRCWVCGQPLGKEDGLRRRPVVSSPTALQ
jgi:hypothetical protein